MNADPLNTYAILLRGVNVGGVTVKMDALRESLSKLPLEGVRTVLASGNAVFLPGFPVRS